MTQLFNHGIDRHTCPTNVKERKIYQTRLSTVRRRVDNERNTVAQLFNLVNEQTFIPPEMDNIWLLFHTKQCRRNVSASPILFGVSVLTHVHYTAQFSCPVADECLMHFVVQCH